MDDLLSRALSVREDIKGMEPLAQLEYVAKLYNDMSASPIIGDMNTFCKAQDAVGGIWKYLAADYKEAQSKELAKRISTVPFCAIGQSYGEEHTQIVDVRISKRFFAKISYKWHSSIRIEFYQNIPDGFGGEAFCAVVIRWKVVPDWLKEEATFVRGHFEKEVTIEKWIETVIETAQTLHNHAKEVASFCKMSSNTDSMGNEIMKYKTWKTKGKILTLTKEMPHVEVIHAKKAEQEFWEHMPGFHGKNGTYVENANPFWNLNIQIKRASYEVTTPTRTSINVHEYITKSLMTKLGWGHITQDRLDLLNEILSGTVLELETSDTSEAALFRKFLPIGHAGWEDYLDTLILPRIKKMTLEQSKRISD